MKIKDELIYDHQSDKIVHKKTHDYTPEMERIKQLREAFGEEQKGADKKLVGVVPLPVIGEWLKEAGVSWDDHYGKAEVIKKKLGLAENNNFQIWKGKY